MVMWGSISLAQSLMNENLIDEYHLQLCPVLTGGGRTLFPGLSDHKKLQLIETRKYNTGTILLKLSARIKHHIIHQSKFTLQHEWLLNLLRPAVLPVQAIQYYVLKYFVVVILFI